MNDITIIKSERGRDLIVYQSYTFYKEKHINEGVKWCCTHCGCLSKLYLDECSTVIFRCELTHEHEEPRNLSRKIISNSAKTKAADQGIYRPLKIIREEIVNAPVELTQQLNIHNNYYVPLIFALLPNKTIETYKNMFKIIIEKCNEFGLLFMPNLFVADFEQAIHNAINEMFPLCKIIGLATDYRSETEIGKWFRNIFGLSFLNAVEVGESYTDNFMLTIPENHTVQEFSDYLVENYISDEGLFPPHIWASDF
ncbi:hypothetical protein QTP88_024626 [Uroleucon formosanum]